MKKVILIAALAFVSLANAQKGTILLGGSIGFGSSKNEQTAVPGGANSEQKLNEFNFSPRVGYQFSDHLTVGIEGSVTSSKNENTTTTPFGGGTVTTSTTTKNAGFAVGPFLRYSKSLSDLFSVYADLGVGFQSNKVTNESNNGFVTTSTENKGDGIYAGITPALFINMKKGFGVNIGIGGIGYQTMSYDDTPTTRDNKSNEFFLTFGQTFNIGISKNF